MSSANPCLSSRTEFGDCHNLEEIIEGNNSNRKVLRFLMLLVGNHKRSSTGICLYQDGTIEKMFVTDNPSKMYTLRSIAHSCMMAK